MKNKQPPILTIYNTHTAACGTPHPTDNDERYVGYFTNELGEQWIFVYDDATQAAILYGGDAGWNQQHEVVDGRVPGLILSDEEQTWLRLCWKAATAFIREA